MTDATATGILSAVLVGIGAAVLRFGMPILSAYLAERKADSDMKVARAAAETQRIRDESDLVAAIRATLPQWGLDTAEIRRVLTSQAESIESLALDVKRLVGRSSPPPPPAVPAPRDTRPAIE